MKRRTAQAADQQLACAVAAVVRAQQRIPCDLAAANDELGEEGGHRTPGDRTRVVRKQRASSERADGSWSREGGQMQVERQLKLAGAAPG